jgi:hypothetical protein
MVQVKRGRRAQAPLGAMGVPTVRKMALGESRSRGARVEALEPRQLLSFSLLTQENFASNLSAAAPDKFDSVMGTMTSDVVGPVTPAVSNSLGVSGDPEENGDQALATTNPFAGNWALNDTTKVNYQAANGGFMGGWFRFVFTDDDTYYNHTADVMRLTDGPAVQLDGNGNLETYSGYPVVSVPTNQWVFIGLAWTFNPAGVLSFQLYTKLPGQALTPAYSSPQSMSTSTPPTEASLVDLPDGGVNNGRWEGRVGTFFIASIGSFSDVQMPSDITDPVEQKHWYGVDPVNGNDNNDGIVIPEFAADGTTVIGFAAGSQPWQTLTRVNTALGNDGVFTQNNAWLNASNGTAVNGTLSATVLQADIAAGTVIRNPLIDELVIDTASGPFNISASGGVNAAGGIQLDTNVNLSGFGSTVGSMSNVGDLQAFVTIGKSSWTPVSGDSFLYETINTKSNAVLWQNREWMNHITGSSFSAVQAGLDATPGSFWTDGVTMYVHPFGNTNPATDSSVYQRSPGGTSTNSIGIFVNANDVYVHNLAIGGTCGADPVTNDPIGLYCVGTSSSDGLEFFSNLYLYYSSKHAFCWTGEQVYQRLIVSNVDCEQGSPYAGSGGQYLYTNYDDANGSTDNQVVYTDDTATHSYGLIGSTQGQSGVGGGTFYSHNNGGSNQFTDITFTDCNFDGGIACTNAVENLVVDDSTIGTIGSAAANTTATDDTTTTDVIRVGSGTITDCIMHADVLYGAYTNNNNFEGAATFDDDIFDSHGATLQGTASYYFGIGPSTLTFENCTFVSNYSVPILYHFQSTDTLVFKDNTYDTATAGFVIGDLITGSSSESYDLAGWQAAGNDVGSVEAADDSAAPGYTETDIGSPTTAGTSLYNATDGLTTQEGGGAGIGGTSDQLNYIYTSVGGNVMYTVEVAAQLGAGKGTVAGLMLRGSTAANSVFAEVAQVAGEGVEFQWRSANGAVAQSVIVPVSGAPLWLQLSRVGNSVTAYYSSTDSNFIQIGSAQTLSIASNALIGTAVAGTPNTGLTAALFSSLQTGPVLTSFQVNDGSAQRAMVNSLTLGFSESVTLSNALTLYQVEQNGGTVTMPLVASTPDGGTTWVVTFPESQYIGGSLPDGNYELTVSALGVTDGHGSTMVGGNQQFSFYRLFGDFLGTGSVSGGDFGLLANHFGKSLIGTPYWYLSFYNQESVNGSDFSAFASRFGKTTPPAPAIVSPSAMLVGNETPAITATTKISTAAAPLAKHRVARRKHR